jgi:hypothetical protein
MMPTEVRYTHQGQFKGSEHLGMLLMTFLDRTWSAMGYNSYKGRVINWEYVLPFNADKLYYYP